MIMKFDTTLLVHDLAEMAAYTQAAEALGFDGIWTAETNHDVFLPLTLAAEHSQRVNLGTAIAVAFPRTPTILAHLAWDLAKYSHGRFILGLGPQVKAHNVLRLGVKWEKPVKRMRETIEAIHALWDCWQHDKPLDFEGEFFLLKLMTPFFNPGPIEYPNPPIYVAAVNEQMLRLAGELCEGVHVHAIHSVKYFDEYALPHLEAGLARGERARANFSVNTAVFAIPTDDPDYAAWAEQFVRQQISFYMSTPAYRVLAELHGWQETAKELSVLARNGRWADMPALINDNMLDTIAVTGTWAELPHIVQQRYGRRIDRLSYYLPYIPGQNEDGWRATIAGFKNRS
ncbi:MAG: TIGR03617 family F420-dependent LLM class oxidoreductase [Chloroflexi bacterium]|nr:TIGR03617 family F420-dependent LLM class oxidoreductase [Ardenticatenaceae bacterium]MBL1131180.1 TIGR03617 family F420-dependent LLM class oxidoreductase [Chloroflexota bacterium]NOG37279.1 TIGR03617 family F420-dependent LLM class oxidoreductase [Chloroflexota bacterium]